MYSRNNAARRPEEREGFNHYRYSVPPQYGGSRFRRHAPDNEVIALPDSAFSVPEAEPGEKSIQEAREPSPPEAELSAAEELSAQPDGAPEAPASGEEAAVHTPLSASVSRLWQSLGRDDLMLAALIVLLYAEGSANHPRDDELIFLLAMLLAVR